ncbi:(5-formylfuran-3-yl)methyl phosphate synthase [Paludisphaera sp.]|uniref:(5-formylfuran-3-yl)methyl phosphate synthase n=1 Tax=Paludisphaera sp. TaxID=2017432 RepID=UPI00301BBEC4
MARLLVSVRSADEARLALAGGASIIDVKEPAHGPLGRACSGAWAQVREVVPADVKLSAALGELTEWRGDDPPGVPPGALAEFDYLKVGLAGVGPDWEDEWRALADRLDAGRVRWIAVAYTDWEAAGAPSPTALLRAAFPFRGVLFDTWDKSKPAAWPPDFLDVLAGFRDRDATIALAGGLTVDRLAEISPFRPDIVAVRGAACVNGRRDGDIDPARVAELTSLVGEIGAG